MCRDDQPLLVRLLSEGIWFCTCTLYRTEARPLGALSQYQALDSQDERGTSEVEHLLLSARQWRWNQQFDRLSLPAKFDLCWG